MITGRERERGRERQRDNPRYRQRESLRGVWGVHLSKMSAGLRRWNVGGEGAVCMCVCGGNRGASMSLQAQIHAWLSVQVQSHLVTYACTPRIQCGVQNYIFKYILLS